MKILFCGGGTAGHVMPALAMREMLAKHFKNCEFAFVGRIGGEENRAVLKQKIKLYTLDVEGVRRSLSFQSMRAIIKALKSGRSAKLIISDFKPDLVIGTGGYVAYPVIRMAQRMKIKTMLHESNAYPGLVTRMLGSKCDKVLLNIDDAKNHLHYTDNISIIGNPIRQGFAEISREEARKKVGVSKKDFFILSFGGSLGAEAINDVIIDVMKKYSGHTTNIKHIHSCGTKHYSRIKSDEPALCIGGTCKIVPYIDDMPTFLRAADIAITRSGAMTVSELTHAEVPAILIPSPNVTSNHQFYNAKFISSNGAGALIEEKNLTADAVINEIQKIKSNPKELEKIRKNMKSLKKEETENLFITAVNSIIR